MVMKMIKDDDHPLDPVFVGALVVILQLIFLIIFIVYYRYFPSLFAIVLAAVIILSLIIAYSLQKQETEYTIKA
jgi:glucan phosphoethanolaminetransferase (alkaline phosphatase superfamily)